MKKILFGLLVLSSLVRFFHLGSLPPALNRDEAAIGYNAYSILKTGRDEHNQPFPLNFKSIGDYKMPLYIYATILPVKLFGLNEFSIRFWSALAGVIAVVAIYLITKNFWAGLFMALNPWAIFYSRIAYEANLALALFLIGFWLVTRKNFWGLAFWLLACLTYSSALIFIPLFLVPVALKYKPKVIWLAGFILVYSLIFISLWRVSSQKQNITIFSDPYLIDTYNRERTLKFQNNPLATRLFFNKYVYFGKIITVNYFKTFSPQFLVLKGDKHPWHQIPGVGNFYFIEIILAVIGLTQVKFFWRSWLLLAPLASAITVDAPHSTRALFLLPVILILAAAGAKKVTRFLPVILLIFLLNFVYAGYQYLQVYPVKAAGNLPVGLKEKIINLKNSGQPIILSGVYDSTYLYALIYLPVDPVVFQQTARWTPPDTAGLSHAYSFNNITIKE